MKRLLLLRHAKAVPHEASNDFERALADRGRDDMAAIARHLAALEERPDLALVSAAARTRETWSLCGLPDVPVRFEEAIYEASPRTLLRLIQRLPDEAARPILVGHNPGLSDLVSRLEASSSVGGLPTAGLVTAEWDVASWRDVQLESGRLVGFVTPGSIGERRDA